MKSLAISLCMALLAGSLLVTAQPVEARHDRFESRSVHRDFRSPPGHAWGHQKHHKHQKQYKQRPSRHTAVREIHYYHYAPPRHVSPRFGSARHARPVVHHRYRDPGIVISFPPIVIPIR